MTVNDVMNLQCADMFNVHVSDDVTVHPDLAKQCLTVLLSLSFLSLSEQRHQIKCPRHYILLC